ncbi:hypothetical protein H4R33_005679 [Dimargaris cristalligena]|nr:hypothetical protein H4R33_005679 [Dimargaris cristalligena]
MSLSEFRTMVEICDKYSSDVLNTHRFQILIQLAPILGVSDIDAHVLRSLLPVHLQSLMLMHGWMYTQHEVRHELASICPDGRCTIQQLAGFRDSSFHMKRLSHLYREIAYVDYTRLNGDQRRVLFPLVDALAQLPARWILQLLDRLRAAVTNHPGLLLAASGVEENDPLLGPLVAGIRGVGSKALHDGLINELLVSTSAVLAVTGLFPKLQQLAGLLKRWNPGHPLPGAHFIGLLVLEYGGPAFRDWAVAWLGRFSGSRYAARQLGWDQAAGWLPPDHHPTGGSTAQWLLRDLTAAMYVYPSRHRNGAAALWIRVRRSPTQGLLRKDSQLLFDDVWFPQDRVQSLLDSVGLILP